MEKVKVEGNVFISYKIILGKNVRISENLMCENPFQ